MSRRYSKTRSRLSVQRLETREMPATLVNPTTVTYQDVDGDDVQVVFSKPILTDANVNQVFKFDNGAVDGGNTNKQQLKSITLNGIAAAAGANITVTATPNAANGGDGFAAVGSIYSTNQDLGTVNVDGDLGLFRAGDGLPAKPGLAGLTARSLGVHPRAPGEDPTNCHVAGDIGFMTIATDVSVNSILVTHDGRFGNLSIGGSLEASQNDNQLELTARHFGSIDIGGNVNSAAIVCGSVPGAALVPGNMGRVTVKGDIESSSISVSNNMGPFIVGSFVSGSLDVTGVSAGIAIAGDLGAGIVCHKPMTRPVIIDGDVFGGAAIGLVGVPTLKIYGSVDSAVRENTIATVFVQKGNIWIGGDVFGGDLANSGSIEAWNASSVVIDGKVAGGTALNSGVVRGQSIRNLSIGGDVVGGPVSQTGFIFVEKVGNLKIGGSLLGGSTIDADLSLSGAISAGTINRLTIAGSAVGGNATDNYNLASSGSIAANSINAVTIGGSLTAGTDNSTGTIRYSGAIAAADSLGVVKVGELKGNATNDAVIQARGQKTPKGTKDVAIRSLMVAGNVEFAKILAGYPLAADGGFNADAQIGSVTVGGDWRASSVAAGVQAGDNGYFGDGDANEGIVAGGKNHPKSFSKIGSVVIRGAALSTDNATDSFAITAEHVGSVKVGTAAAALKRGMTKDDLLVGGAGDLRVKEI